MKFAFASLLVVAAALLPAAQASMDITFTADKFARRAEKAAPVAVEPTRNPEFGIFLNNRYLIHNGEGLPEPKDVKETYPECKWRKYGQWACCEVMTATV